ncbi:MAG: type II secretion system F family protein [Candidatus Eremiobacteraeota bacterium]|nr:type II secretion system F family protein [Candidatus Eremiobacteraeota bacterium]
MLPQFIFTYLNENKRPVTGIIEAPDRESALKRLSTSYSTVIEIKEVKERKVLFGGSISGEELQVVTRQLATMLRAGVPLLRALEIITSDSENAFLQSVFVHITEGVKEGKAISEMLSRHPNVFPRFYLFMVESGETGGKLPEILFKLAEYIENAENLKKKVKSALMYPVTVMILAFAISVFIFMFGVKQFEEIYKGLDAPLPFSTQIFLAVADFMWRYWYLIAAGVMATLYLLSRYVRTSKGELVKDRMLLKLPVIGPLLRRLAIARFARTLSSLLSGGVSTLKSIELVSGSVGNRVMEKMIMNLLRRTKEGESMAESLRQGGEFTKMAVSMIATGEESGTLETMLNEIADFYELQVDVMLKNMASLIEPLVIVVVGIFVGLLIISLGMPLFNLVQVLG